MPNPLRTMISRLLTPIIDKTVRDQLAVAENDNTFLIGTRRYDESERDRLEYDRADILEQCLEAWRESPLAAGSLNSPASMPLAAALTSNASTQPPVHSLINSGPTA